MPSTVNQRYDHPAYTTPYPHSGSTAVGANGVSTKFAALTAMQIRKAIFAPNVASTSASQPLMFKKSGTTTTTTTLSAITSAAVDVKTNVLATAVSLAAGDQFWFTHGTDATMSLSVAAEVYITPGADITAP